MATYLQQDRPLRLETTLGPDKLILRGFLGAEAVSRPYRFVLDLASTDAAIDGASLLRTALTITVSLPGGHERHIHGWISRFVQLGQNEDLTLYQAEVVPRLWFAGLVHDCRIFQNLTAPAIVEEILKKHNVDYRLKLTGTYPKREYCVQYRESDLAFISRLLEEEGIFYWFDHSGSREQLLLADSNSALPKCPEQATARMALQADLQEDAVQELQREHAAHTSKVTLNSYSYLEPRLSLKESVSSSVSGFGEEVYDYGDHTTGEEARRRARLRIEGEEVREQTVKGRSTCRAFMSGARFKLQSHFNPKLNVEYMLAEIRHEATGNWIRAGGESSFVYKNEFTGVPFSVKYRPACATPKPVVAGTQTALVVGPQGEEIYTEANGRVKVQFYWDRLGKKDDKSSCWVRVASAWAGKSWGAIHLPRIGQEVVVAFEEGDPDRPLVVGSVYNADQTPPYALPGNQTQSGVKSRSSKGGAADNFNEIRLEDKKGSEQINVQAEKDLSTLVKNDETRDVQHDRTTTIKNDDTRTVTEGKDVHLVKKGDQNVTLETGNQAIDIQKGNRSLTLGQGSDTVNVKQGDQTVTVGQGKQTVEVKADQTITVKQGNQTVDVKMGDQIVKVQMGNQDVTIGMGNQTINVRMGNRQVKVNLGSIQEQAMQGIELKVGPSSIKIDNTGVTIKGMMVKIEGQLQSELKGLMTTVNGNAMLKLGGAVTMIG